MPFDQQHAPRLRAGLNRRNLPRGSIVAGGIAATGAADIGTAQAQRGADPGLLPTQADLDRMRQKVLTWEEPWISGWNRLFANGHSHPGRTRRPLDVVIRSGDGQNYPNRYNDIHATHRNALRRRDTGTTSNRGTAVNILGFDELGFGTLTYVR